MMPAALSIFLSLFSVLVPQKMWYPVSQPVTISIKSDKDVTLVLTDFSGKPIAAKGSADVAAGASVDVKAIFPDIAGNGAWILYAVPKGSAPATGTPKDFLGTPVVIETLANIKAAGGEPMVIHIVPLQYAKMTTDAGPITMIFYYDAAPHTADSFLTLASQGFFDGLTFHRIVPGFVIQGGDPAGTGTGGPGYHIDAEFNDRAHVEGALSMARNGDPAEADGTTMPRPQWANSAGTQFFICLDYSHTKSLDGKYTVFGKVIDGFDPAVKKIASANLSDPQNGKPETPQVIQKVEVFKVTAANNPYANLKEEKIAAQ
jgi:cyclophilin family peptidyl-prolyl cis-trans isomerase